MARCGCAQGNCSCKFEDSTDVTWTGTGIKSNPFLATPAPLLITDDTTSLALTLEIDSDTATLRAEPIIQAYTDVFTSDGTWTKPSGVMFTRVILIAGGGGGASGRSGSGSASLRKGGGGGDAGQVVNLTLVGADIPASAAIQVGQGGLGGAAVIANDGTAGAAGTDSKFGARLVRGGIGGDPLEMPGNHLALGNPPGQWAAERGDWLPAHPYLAPGAGGSGESADWVWQPGGFSLPGQGSRWPVNFSAATNAGEDGPDELVTRMGGGGAGGGRGEAGGNGGLYGGGGGGGGYESNSSLFSGAGGNGADGIVVVISW